MGLFQRSKEDAYADEMNVADSSADADQVASTRDRFSGLQVPERAAEVLGTIGPAQVVARGLPE
jgi:hypothetical protein